MGIYDRDYVRNRRVGGTMGGGVSGRTVGVLGMFSVNTWIIIINFAVFVFGLTLANSGVPVLVESRLSPNVQGQLSIDHDYLIQGGARGQLGTRVASPQDLRRVGNLLFKRYLDASGRMVGTQEYIVMDPLEAYGHFSTARAFFRVEVWRFVTFQFLHANLTHVFFNMFGLFIFGGLVEQQLGPKRYAAFYLVCGVFGGVSYLILNVLGAGLGLRLPGVLFGDIHTPLIGASAGVFGVIIACARIAPNAVVYLIFPPIPLRMKWLAYGYVGLAVVNLLRAGQNAGGDAAHVGGAIAGWFFIRNAHLLRDFFDIFGDSRKGPRRPKPHGPSQLDIDRILRKVGEHGMDSLSEKEKRLLARASEAERRRG